MDCSQCGGSNRADARFCGHCGAPLERTAACRACGRENPVNQVFCDACGRRLAVDTTPVSTTPPRSYTPPHLAARILTNRSTLEGERRHVTVLFADVADYTALAESVDPEEVHALMDRCFQRILERVHYFEGTVNQFTGDGVMALFGAPLALEDAPRRAVKAALAIQESLGELDAQVQARFGRPFRMRIGIHSGSVVVGKIGDDLRMDYTAVGDTTNLASRLEQLARPGSVVISENTRRAVAGFFNLRDLGDVRVKGRRASVRAWEVVSERPVSGRIEALADTGLTPLVGREHELAQLREAFTSAVQGRGRVAFVVGEAGIGKSRLLYELQHTIADQPHFWVEGRCASYASNTPFSCISDCLRRSFGIDERDDERTALAKVEATEHRLGGGLDWTLPYLRDLLSLPSHDAAVESMDSITRRSETFRALRARFLRETERQPFVILIEDLHWIDTASEEFLAYLAEAVPATRALMILTYRPGYSHPFGDRSYHVRISLQPLSEAETERLASAVLGVDTIPDALRPRIAHKAEGNPFFIEEVVRSLLEDGTLRRHNGTVELTRDPQTITIPNAVQDVIMARLDRLGDEQKRALQVAAVIGREFALRLLQRALEAGKRVGALLEELRALELVYEKALDPELAYMFKHALTHDVAYESILTNRRKALHALVARAIEEVYAERLTEHYEALAHHYTRSEQWAKAFRYRVLAGDKAARAYANQVAASHYRDALMIARAHGEVTTREEHARLERTLAGVFFLINEYAQAADAYCRAAEFAADAELRALALASAAWCAHWGHDFARAERLAAQATAIDKHADAPAGLASARIVTCFIHATNRGDLQPLVSACERASDLPATSAANETVIALAKMVRAELAEWRGRFTEALDLIHSLETAGLHTKGPWLLTQADWFAGKALCCAGRYREALERLGAAADRTERVGDRAMHSRLLNTLGWCYSELGCHHHAIAVNMRATEIGRALVAEGLMAAAPELYANAAVNLAGNYIALGELGAADELLATVEEELATSADPWMKWRYRLHTLDARARYLLAVGDPDRALALLDEELAGARRHDAAKLEARALERRARALLLAERWDDAEVALEDALELAGAIGYPPVVWHTHALRGELRHRRGDDRNASAAREAATRVALPLVRPLVEGIRDTATTAARMMIASPLRTH